MSFGRDLDRSDKLCTIGSSHRDNTYSKINDPRIQNRGHLILPTLALKCGPRFITTMT